MNKELSANANLSHYRILSRIGAGGMGEVYLAEDTRLGRKVALKILNAELTKHEDRVRRFEQEARAASALSHPNILTIFDIGTEDSTHFIATEYIGIRFCSARRAGSTRHWRKSNARRNSIPFRLSSKSTSEPCT